MATSANRELEAEFDVLVGRAGLVLPLDRRADLLVAFADLKTEIARLYAAPLPPTLEPARIFRLEAPGAGR